MSLASLLWCLSRLFCFHYYCRLPRHYFLSASLGASLVRTLSPFCIHLFHLPFRLFARLCLSMLAESLFLRPSGCPPVSRLLALISSLNHFTLLFRLILAPPFFSCFVCHRRCSGRLRLYYLHSLCVPTGIPLILPPTLLCVVDEGECANCRRVLSFSLSARGCVLTP